MGCVVEVGGGSQEQERHSSHKDPQHKPGQGSAKTHPNKISTNQLCQIQSQSPPLLSGFQGLYPFLSYVLLTLIINRSMEAQDTQNVSLSSDPYLRGVIDRTIGEAGLKQLQNARVIFSNIVNKSHNKRYIINKIHGETPHFPLDWDLYSIFKAHARILMTSGEIVRDEKEYQLFKDYAVFEKNNSLLSYFKARNPSPQKVFILSNNVSDQQVTEFLNPSLYSPVLIKGNHADTTFDSIEKEETLNGYIRKLLSLESPLLLQGGVTTFDEYLVSADENLIDFLLVTEFEGEIPEKCKGKEFGFHLDNHFKLLYSSPEVQCPGGNLVFYVYGPKGKGET